MKIAAPNAEWPRWKGRDLFFSLISALSALLSIILYQFPDLTQQAQEPNRRTILIVVAIAVSLVFAMPWLRTGLARVVNYQRLRWQADILVDMLASKDSASKTLEARIDRLEIEHSQLTIQIEREKKTINQLGRALEKSGQRNSNLSKSLKSILRIVGYFDQYTILGAALGNEDTLLVVKQDDHRPLSVGHSVIAVDRVTGELLGHFELTDTSPAGEYLATLVEVFDTVWWSTMRRHARARTSERFSSVAIRIPNEEDSTYVSN